MKTYAPEIREMGDAIVELTVLQARALSEYIYEQYGISADAVTAPEDSALQPVVTRVEDAKSSVDVVLVRVTDASKIATIKTVRALKNLGLKEAKDLVDSAPVTLWSGVSSDEAAKLKTSLEESGAVIEVK